MARGVGGGRERGVTMSLRHSLIQEFARRDLTIERHRQLWRAIRRERGRWYRAARERELRDLGYVDLGGEA